MDIAKEIGTPALLGQTAEECTELAQAAKAMREILMIRILDELESSCDSLAKALLKYQRILMGTNPTPVTEEEARATILEEATDVQDCLRMLGKVGFATVDHIQSREKMHRWEQRIREAKKAFKKGKAPEVHSNV